uniref:C2H2-type domain-containing protein n=1 Tax=Timema poppense TaxID=170557 RepID=A0A7R9H9X8_TIMPO|nr:unnamed protein product [Timema poppensis]
MSYDSNSTTMSSDIHCNTLYNDHRSLTSLGVCHEYIMSSDVPVEARSINDMDTDLHLENVMCKAECSMVHEEVTALPLEMEKSRLNNPLDLTKLEVPTSQLCRVCATLSEALTPIFGKKSKEMELVKKIHTHLPILNLPLLHIPAEDIFYLPSVVGYLFWAFGVHDLKSHNNMLHGYHEDGAKKGAKEVNENDVLPVNVCDPCVEKLQICHDLVTTCSESDVKLRQMMGLPVEKDMPEMEAVNVDVIGKEEPLCDKPLREDKVNESESEEEEDERDNDSDWEDQQPSDPPSPAPSEPKRKRGVTKVRKRKINISAKLKQPLGTGGQEEDKLDMWLKGVWRREKTGRRRGHGEKEDVEEADHLNPLRWQNCSKHQSPVRLACWKWGDDVRIPVVSTEGIFSSIVFHSPSMQVQVKNQKYKIVMVKTKSKSPMTQKDILNILKTQGDQHKLFVPGKKYKTSILRRVDKASSLVKKGGKDTWKGISEETIKAETSTETTAEQPSITEPIEELEKYITVSDSKNILSYVCMYCAETLVGTENLISHHSSLHTDKVSICTLCSPHIIYYESRHSYEKHMIRHAPALNEVDTVAPLPIAVTTSVDDATEDIKPDNLEITSVLNVQVEAPRCMTRSASKLNNANIRMEMSQEFQSVSKNIQSKILGTIRKLASNSKENKEKGLLTNTEGVRVNNENVRVKIIGGTKVLIERKMKKPTSKYGWYCRQCDVMFESSEELDDHKGRNMCSNHPCQFCDKKFKTKNSLVKHERLHTNERPYMCEQCGKSFRTRTILRSHLDTHDKSRKFICTDCGKAFNNKANFKHHTATHLNRAFLCDICGKTLKSLSYLRVHKLNHKNPDLLKRFACDMCGNKYVSRHQMKQHRRLHTNERPYKCPDPNCFKMFRNLVTLKQHASVHTNMRKYKCEACGKGFKRRSHLMTHRKTHDQHQRFRCGICPDSFNNLGELLSHRSSHTEEELKLANKDSLKCPECSKILLNKVTLKNHMLTHSNERPFPCSFCEKSFKNKTHRDNHLRLHTGEKPFICRFCKAAFTVSERLVVHERIHTGETPFKCNMCDKAFRSKINLIQHSKIHSDNRPFICSLCARAFRRREALDMHMRTHTGERPYACKYCNRAFKQKGDCNKHQKTHFKSGGPVMETPLV